MLPGEISVTPHAGVAASDASEFPGSLPGRKSHENRPGASTRRVFHDVRAEAQISQRRKGPVEFLEGDEFVDGVALQLGQLLDRLADR